MLWRHSLGMSLVIPTHPELCHNLMWSHFYISKTACEGHFSRREQLVLVFNSSLCFWRSFGKRRIPEGGCGNTSLPAPSKLCCPAQSDKEATGTASGVWSLINRQIRLILQFFDGAMQFICSTHHFFSILSTYELLFSKKMKILLLIATTPCLNCNRIYIKLLFPPQHLCSIAAWLIVIVASGTKGPRKEYPRPPKKPVRLFEGTEND